MSPACRLWACGHCSILGFQRLRDRAGGSAAVRTAVSGQCISLLPRDWPVPQVFRCGRFCMCTCEHREGRIWVLSSRAVETNQIQNLIKTTPMWPSWSRRGGRALVFQPSCPFGGRAASPVQAQHLGLPEAVAEWVPGTPVAMAKPSRWPRPPCGQCWFDWQRIPQLWFVFPGAVYSRPAGAPDPAHHGPQLSAAHSAFLSMSLRGGHQRQSRRLCFLGTGAATLTPHKPCPYSLIAAAYPHQEEDLSVTMSVSP